MPESPSLAQEPPQCTLGAPAGLKGIYGVLGQQDPRGDSHERHEGAWTPEVRPQGTPEAV